MSHSPCHIEIWPLEMFIIGDSVLDCTVLQHSSSWMYVLHLSDTNLAVDNENVGLE